MRPVSNVREGGHRRAERRTAMKKVQGVTVCTMVVAFIISLISLGIAQAETVFSIFTRDFRLDSQSALLTRERGGDLRADSLELPSPGKTPVYGRILAQEAALESNAPRMTVVLAKH